MNYKVESVGEVEKRVIRIFKEVDLNNMVKQIRGKANSEEIKKELLILETKYTQMQE